MKSRVLLNVALLGMLALLAWFVVNPGPSSEQDNGVALTSVRPESVREIVIEREGRAVAQLQRQGDSWFVRAPLAARADLFRVQSLFGLLGARSRVGFRAAGNDLAQFGLEPPRATLHFGQTVLYIGNADPVDGMRYVLSDGEVHLIEDNWFSTIFGNGTAWIDPSPLPPDVSLKRISVERDSLPTREWHLGEDSRQPIGTSGDAPQAAGAQLANAWSKARALSVRNRQPALNWNARVRVNFVGRPPAGAQGTDAQGSDAHGLAVTHELVFDVAEERDALFLARRDLDIQYRFLKRQGAALMGEFATP